MEFRRAAKVIALSAAMHGPILGGYAYHNSKPLQKAQLAVEDGYTTLTSDLSSMLQYREREALKKRAHAGEIGLGEFIIRANDIDERAKGRGFDVGRAVADYKARHHRFNEQRKKGDDPREALYFVTYDMDYHGGMGGILGRDMLQKSLNCEAIALLGAALAYDSGFEVDLRHYYMHLAAVIWFDGRQYDPQRGERPIMKGVPFAASSLIWRYDSVHGGFAYPYSEDGYPGWIPLFHKGAFSSPLDLERERGRGPGASARQTSFDGVESLPPIFFQGPPIFDNLKIGTASLAHGGETFDFTTYAIADKLNLDVVMTDLSPMIIFATSSARFTSTSTPAEDAIWSGSLVGMLQKVELYSAMIGRNQVSEEARAQKTKALEEGRASLEKIGDPVSAFLDRHLEPKDPNMDPRLIAFLPPTGPKMLVEIASRYAKYLGESHPVPTYFFPRYSLMQYLGIAPIQNQVLAIINALPVERKAEFAFDSTYASLDHVDFANDGTNGEGCAYDFCKVAGIVRRLNRVYGIEDNMFSSYGYLESIRWSVEFDDYQFHLRGMMNDIPEGNRWVASVFVVMDTYMRQVMQACNMPSNNCDKENGDRVREFVKAMRDWEPE